MKEEIEKQSTNDVEVTLRKELFPKLNAHYEDLKKENADECIFKGVELLPGWMVVKETHEIDRVTRKKRKVIEWADRTPADCLEDLASLCQTVADKMDSRYMKCVTNAAHVLGGCFHIPDVLCLLQRSNGSDFSAHQQTALHAYGNAVFESFFKYVCSLPHITKLADEEPELSLLPSLSQQVHKSFKDAVYQVVWNNLGDCRNDWFPPLEGAHCQTLLREFKVKSGEFEIEDRFTFK